MAKITSSIKKEKYKIEITSPTGNLVISDEPIDKGRKDLGFSPKELLASALAACSSATVKMYADRKEWDLREVKINIELEFIANEDKTIMNRKTFLKSLAVLPLTAAAMEMSELDKMTSLFDSTDKIPVLFLGHGSPMNAIEENEFVVGFRKVILT